MSAVLLIAALSVGVIAALVVDWRVRHPRVAVVLTDADLDERERALRREAIRLRAAMDEPGADGAALLAQLEVVARDYEAMREERHRREGEQAARDARVRAALERLDPED